MTTSNSNSTISLTTNPTSNGVVVVLEPYAIHIINSIVQDLTFLHQQGYIEKDVLDEISCKLPKPALQKNKNTTTSSPTSSVATPQSPAPQSPAPQSSAPSPKTINSTMDSPVLEERGESTNGIQKFPLPTQHEINSINAQLNQFVLKNSSSRASLTNSIEGSNYSDTSLTKSPRLYPTHEQYEKRNTTEKLIAQKYQSSAEATRYNINENEGIERHFDNPYSITLPNAPLAIAEALWDFNNGDEGDLAFQKGDKIEVFQCVNEEWWYGKIQGQPHYGIFPKVFTKILSLVNYTIPNDPVTNDSSNGNTLTYYPPPPQPLNPQTPSQPPQPQKPKLLQQKQQQQKQAIKSSNQPNKQIQYQKPARPISQVVYPNPPGQPLSQNGRRTTKRTSYPNYLQLYSHLQTINNRSMRPPTSNK